jgi:hypothetical protein
MDARLVRRRLHAPDLDGADLRRPTYVVPGLTWVTCRACGSTTYARDHLETILTEASDWIARPKALAEAIVALVDTEQSVPRLHERIKKWGHRERIAASGAPSAGTSGSPKRAGTPWSIRSSAIRGTGSARCSTCCSPRARHAWAVSRRRRLLCDDLRYSCPDSCDTCTPRGR